MKKEQNLQETQEQALNIPVVSGRFSVKISEIIALRERMKEININDLSNIDFISDNGDIIIIVPGDIQTYAGCSHIFVNGKHKNHSRNKNGGCTVKTSKGIICTKCNYTKDFSLDSTVTYSPCPH